MIHRRKGILAFAAFWWPVWFIAITAAEMGFYHGATAAITTVVAEVAALILTVLLVP
jgi:hypothetical protein